MLQLNTFRHVDVVTEHDEVQLGSNKSQHLLNVLVLISHFSCCCNRTVTSTDDITFVKND